MVARNVWGSKSRLFLAATFRLMVLRSVWSIGMIWAWRAIPLPRGEPLGWRAGDIGTSLLPIRQRFHFTAFSGRCEYPKTTARHAQDGPNQGKPGLRGSLQIWVACSE